MDIEAIAKKTGRYTCRDGHGRVVGPDELTQAARIGVWKAQMSYDPQKNSREKSWLQLRAYGVARDIVRSESRHLSVTVELREAWSIHAESGQVDQLDRQIDADRAISRLTDPYRIVVALLFKEGMTVEETAGQLHVSVGTIVNWRNRAVSDLTAALADRR